MTKKELEVFESILSYYSTPVGVAPIIKGVSRDDISLGDMVGIFTSLVQTTAGIAGMVGKSGPPAIGVVITSGALFVDGQKIKVTYDLDGIVLKADMYSAASNLSALAGSVALIVAAGGVAVPALLATAVLATVASAVFTMASLASGEAAVDVSHTMESLKTAISAMAAELGETYTDAIGFLATSLSKAEDFGEAIGDYISSALVDLSKQLFNAGDYVDSNLAEAIKEIQKMFNQALATVSPLVLDLDGNGVDTLSIAEGVHFDHDGNGFAELTGWAGPNDGMLVWDKNSNGQIDNGNELFGNHSMLSSGGAAVNGFAALADLDANNDGRVDADDPAFTLLQIWKDANSNGKVDVGELMSLSSLGIKSVNTPFVEHSQTDAQGNQVLQVGSYTRLDGSSLGMNDIWFAVNFVDTVETVVVDVGEDILALPDIAGVGNMPSLHQAMAQDVTGELKNLLMMFIQNIHGSGHQDLIDKIIYSWAGVGGVSPDSRGDFIDDARKLNVLEAVLGKSFIQWAGTIAVTSNPGLAATAMLLEAYDKFRANISENLTLKALLTPYLSEIRLVSNGAGVEVDYSGLLDKVSKAFAVDPVNTFLDMLAIKKFPIITGPIEISAIVDRLISDLTFHDREAIEALRPDLKLGSGASDLISAIGTGSYSVLGGDGDDILSTDRGDDVLQGGRGDDFIKGGRGADTYIFNLGDGKDVVLDDDFTYSGNDVLRFGAGIQAADISASRSGLDMVFRHANGQDSVTVSNWFAENSGRYQLERIEFNDGDVWVSSQITAGAYADANREQSSSQTPVVLENAALISVNLYVESFYY